MPTVPSNRAARCHPVRPGTKLRVPIRMAVISSDIAERLTIDGVSLQVKLRRAERTRRWIAFGLTLPLLLFLLISFIFPICSMLVLSVKSPELTEVLPGLVNEIQTWDGKEMPPPDRVLKVFASEVVATFEAKRLGKAAKRLNYHQAGFRSLMMKTGKTLKRQADAEGLAVVVNDPRLFDRLKQIDKRVGVTARPGRCRVTPLSCTRCFIFCAQLTTTTT